MTKGWNAADDKAVAARTASASGRSRARQFDRGRPFHSPDFYRIPTAKLICRCPCRENYDFTICATSQFTAAAALSAVCAPSGKNWMLISNPLAAAALKTRWQACGKSIVMDELTAKA